MEDTTVFATMENREDNTGNYTLELVLHTAKIMASLGEGNFVVIQTGEDEALLPAISIHANHNLGDLVKTLDWALEAIESIRKHAEDGDVPNLNAEHIGEDPYPTNTAKEK